MLPKEKDELNLMSGKTFKRKEHDKDKQVCMNNKQIVLQNITKFTPEISELMCAIVMYKDCLLNKRII